MEIETKNNRTPKNMTLYRMLFRQAGVGMGFYTSEGRVIDYNETALKHISKKRSEVAGKHISELFPAKESGIYLDRIKETVKSDEPLVFEDEVVLAQGMFWFRSIYSKITDDSGNTSGVQVISNDISKKSCDRKKISSRTKTIKTVS